MEAELRLVLPPSRVVILQIWSTSDFACEPKPFGRQRFGPIAKAREFNGHELIGSPPQPRYSIVPSASE